MRVDTTLKTLQEENEMKKIIFLFTILILSICIDTEAVITVRLSGGDHNNFQDAIDAATGTETILVGNGTYTGAKNRNIMIDKEGINLTIESENGSGVCIIDAQGLDRVIGISNVNTADSVVLRGFTIKNGDTASASGGGGIYNHNSVVTVEDCVILNNTSKKGGGIYSGGVAGSLTMSNCFILDNTSSVSSSGGGMHIANMQVTVTDCVFSNNSMPNPAMHGGCMYISYGDSSFTNCLFEGNSAYGSGGLFFNSKGNVSFTNCTVAGNSCTANGGVGFISGTSISPATVTLTNCIFDGNIADGASDLFHLISTSGSAILNYSYSNLDPSKIGGSGGTINDLGNNINADPLFGTAGYWDTGTWIPGDYHLKSMIGRWSPSAKTWVVDGSHSPCIDTGDEADSYALEPAPNGSRINMGYYGNSGEASKSPECGMTLLADIDGDCYVDIYDFAIMAQEWLMCDIQPSPFCWQ